MGLERSLDMRQWIPAVLLPFAFTLSSTSHALAPGDLARGFREGANHHVGDDSFLELFGRAPDRRDDEHVRMHAHFTHVRGWLASRRATRPELEARRAEILGYFDEYIAKGTTPQNAHLPWRTPVFIDDHGTICAVGYLIEKTAGRPLAEKVARDHRYALLEDIAAAMPEVRAWVESSGFALEELASVQPGYIPPTTWNVQDLGVDPGVGTPLVLDATAQKGFWQSKSPDGAPLAEGPFVDGRPQGTWRFFHASGNLAAKGTFDHGLRDGRWQFFYDTKESIPVAIGSFMGGNLIEEWRHFDTAGKLVARARPASPYVWGSAGYLLDLVPDATGVHHWVHQGRVADTHHRLDFLADGNERIYLHDGAETAFDDTGHKLTRGAGPGEWQSSDCHWNRMRRESAQSGDLVTLHGLTFAHEDTCDAPRAVSAARGKHLDAMLTSLRRTPVDVDPAQASSTLVSRLASNMASYLSRPSLDAGAPTARFVDVGPVATR